MKKEISDHLARAFFETKARREKQYSGSFIFYAVMGIALLAALVLGSMAKSYLSAGRLRAGGEIFRLDRYDGPYILKFDFSNSASDIAAIDIEIPGADLNRFAELGFAARLRGTEDNSSGAVKVTLVNKRRETSSQYIPEINPSWKKFVIPLSGFDKIADLSGSVVLSFGLEPWNIFAKKGELLIEDIRFLKN